MVCSCHADRLRLCNAAPLLGGAGFGKLSGGLVAPDVFGRPSRGMGLAAGRRLQNHARRQASTYMLAVSQDLPPPEEAYTYVWEVLFKPCSLGERHT
jgi:hypothetical protein